MQHLNWRCCCGWFWWASEDAPVGGARVLADSNGVGRGRELANPALLQPVAPAKDRLKDCWSLAMIVKVIRQRRTSNGGPDRLGTGLVTT